MALRHQPAGRLLQPRDTLDKDYRFDFVRDNYTPEALGDAPTAPTDNPVKRVHPGALRCQRCDQVNELTVGKTNTYERVMAIYRYFSVPTASATSCRPRAARAVRTSSTS